MSFVYASFLRRPGEGLLQFDNRVLHMLPVIAGTVFFDMCNYVWESGEFRVYIEWNAELSEMLQDRLPSGGYFVKATAGQAEEFDRQTDGVPVYMKLIAREGRLYPYRTYVMWNGRPFSVEFNGNRLIPVDYKEKAAGGEHAKKGAMQHVWAGSRKNAEGSRKNREITVAGESSAGSQKEWRMGSQNFLLGKGGLYEWFRSSERRAYGSSQRGWAGIAGSQSFWQTYTAWMSGSNRSLLMGSERGYLSGSNRGFLPGSERGFMIGSQSFWQMYLSYLSGSSRGVLSGSEYGFWMGRNCGFFAGSRFDCGQVSQDMDTDSFDWQFLPSEWQLINRFRRPHGKKGGNGMFGYGLDLIDV